MRPFSRDACAVASVHRLPLHTAITVAARSIERKAELKALAERPDSEIDYSDIAPLDETFWARAVPNPFFKPVKTHASVRIDSDVLLWLKSQGKGYQTRMNAILREAMIRSQQPKA